MQMTEIRREPVSRQGLVNNTMTLLAKNAESLLGYKALAKALSIPTAAREATEIQAALDELEIECLNKIDVFRYQQERLIEETGTKLRAWMEQVSHLLPDDPLSGFSGPSWTIDKIGEYQQPIPEFVLAKAIKIKERLPECEIIVESFSDHPDPFLIVGTKPPYSWSKPDEYYYVEVWAEPKFEKDLWRTRDEEIPF